MNGGEEKKLPGWLTRLVRVDTAIAKVEGWIVVASLLLMLLLFFLYAVFRNVSASLGANWLVDLPMQLVLLVSVFGGAIAARSGRHIAIDIAPRILPRKALGVVRLVTNVAAVGMCVVLCVAGWRYLFVVVLVEGAQLSYINVTIRGGTLVAIPTWLFVAAVPVAFALAGWHFLVLTLRELCGDSPVASGEQLDAAVPPADSGKGEATP